MSDTRNPKLAPYPLRTELVITLQGIEGMCENVFTGLLGSTADRGLEPEDDETAVLDAIEECDRIALAAKCLRGRLEDEIKVRG